MVSQARQAGRFLAEADRVGELAELIGLTTLQPRQRMAILAGRLLREGLLQQSAVSTSNAYSDAARSAAPADSVIAVADRCDALAGEGVAPSLIEDRDYSALLRARKDAGTAEQVQAMADHLLESLSALRHDEVSAGERPGLPHN